MSVYEKHSDGREYIYLKKQNEPSLPGMFHTIAGAPNFHKAIEFIFLIEGTQTAILNGIQYTATAGDIIFAASLVPHSYPECEGVDGYILLLSDFFLQFYKSEYGDKTWLPILNNKEKNREIFKYVADWHLNQSGTSYEGFNKANVFLSMMCKAYEPVNIKMCKTSELTIEILSYIDKNFTNDISLKKVASELGYTKQYCSKIFNETMHESFRKYLNRKRILAFNSRWTNENNKNKETILNLAFSCGFDSQSTFYRAYHDVFHTNPKLK